METKIIKLNDGFTAKATIHGDKIAMIGDFKHNGKDVPKDWIPQNVYMDVQNLLGSKVDAS